MKTLMFHQEKALDYAIPRGRIALYMEMRLGKTLVVIRWLKHNQHSCVLILTPKATHPSWLSELADEGIQGFKPEGSLTSRFEQAQTYLQKHKKLFLILNYEAVTLYPDFLSLPYGAIVCDESTYIRNPSAKITKLLCKHTDHILHKAIMSGLPAPESAKDYFCQFKFLYDSFMHEHIYWYWQRKYCQQVGYGWEVRPSQIPVIKREVHENAFVMTRKEAKMGGKKVYERRYVDVSGEQIKLMKQIDKDFEYKKDEEEKMTKHSPVKYLWLAQVAGGFTPEGTLISTAKTDEILSLLRGDLKGERIVIWFRFNRELEFVAKKLRDFGYKVGIFTAKEKTGVNADGTLSNDIQIMCAQEKCGKMGMPWYHSSTMIFYSNHYDFEVRAQCEDRGIHKDNTDPYLIIDLITESSIDEEAINILLEKKTSAKYFMSRLEQAWEGRKCQK